MVEENLHRESSRAQLEAYYASLSREDDVVSRCVMWLPTGADGMALRGKTVLDVACRKGKGVYEIAEDVGPNGHALGLDWNSDFIDAARAGQAHAMAKMPWVRGAGGAGRTSEATAQASGSDTRSRMTAAKNPMQFFVGFPEDLVGAGIPEHGVDLVFVNTAASMFFNPQRAYTQIARVLRDGGHLHHEMVCVDAAGEQQEMSPTQSSDESRNSLPASLVHAPTKEDFIDRISSAGFSCIQVVSEEPLQLPGTPISEYASGKFIDLVIDAEVHQ